jgi:hypothetical protein
MRRALRPATFVLAAVLVSLAACSSPTAPAPVKKQVAPARMDSGIVLPTG